MLSFSATLCAVLVTVWGLSAVHLRESVSTEENLADENPVLKDPAMTGLLGHGEVWVVF